jgi:outer membrane protein
MKKITKVATVLAAMAATTALAGTAQAADGKPDGKIQIKLLATGVLPSGSLSSVNDPHGLTATGGPLHGLNTAANNNVTPTVAIEYFIVPSISVETIAGISSHHVSSPALGVGVVDHAQVIPFTLTAKYHVVGVLPFGIKPYVGAGPTLFAWINDRPSAALQGLGVTRTKLSSELGAVVQAGFDVPVGHGYSLNFDAKKYFVKTNAHFYTAALGDTLDASVRLNPWVISTGVAYRF